jgi:hypothetical protein
MLGRDYGTKTKTWTVCWGVGDVVLSKLQKYQLVGYRACCVDLEPTLPVAYRQTFVLGTSDKRKHDCV